MGWREGGEGEGRVKGSGGREGRAEADPGVRRHAPTLVGN